MKIEALNAPASELGEGVFLDEKSHKLYWVDINKGSLYQYDLQVDKLINTFYLEGNPSCIFSVSDESLVYVDNIGLKILSLKDGSVESLNIHPEHCSDSFRANDGVLLSDGRIIYGTMAYSPENKVGKIYCLDINLVTTFYDLGISIPNTFIQIKDKLLISDSLSKCIYEKDLNYLHDNKLSLWKDFSNCSYTPDGGCLSERGYVHVALWDGAAIAVFDKYGQLIQHIELPVLRPTNCCFYNKRWLYITSAKEGMTTQQLKEYPLSGKTLLVDLGSHYEY